MKTEVAGGSVPSRCQCGVVTMLYACSMGAFMVLPWPAAIGGQPL